MLQLLVAQEFIYSHCASAEAKKTSRRLTVVSQLIYPLLFPTEVVITALCTVIGPALYRTVKDQTPSFPLLRNGVWLRETNTDTALLLTGLDNHKKLLFPKLLIGKRLGGGGGIEG